MVEVYDAHEQGEIVKKWLQENGGAIVMGLVIAFGGLFGFKQWQGWEASNQQQASVEFEVMGELLSQGQLDAAMANFQTLKDEHGKSPYATMAALQMARARIETDQPDLAVGLYQFVVDNGYPRAMSVIARERLARLLLSQGQAAEALVMIDGADDTSGFESRFAATRGDIQFALGDVEAAGDSWQIALDTMEAGVGDRAALEMKLQDIGASSDNGTES